MREIRDVTVGELMSKPAVTVTPETTVEALRDLMTKYDFNAFPVVNDADVLLASSRGSISSVSICCGTRDSCRRPRKPGFPRSARS